MEKNKKIPDCCPNCKCIAFVDNTDSKEYDFKCSICGHDFNAEQQENSLT